MFQTIESLPDIITAQHISDYLHISRRRVYELLEIPESQGGIRCFSIGISKRVDKRDFLAWIERQKKPVS
ncbi:helix-turn-helix domain-containing protein [Paenibacillus rhizophilus]|uniref:DNA-binding protein n=1 Tax=Paenibacillus rhizophilus TaxID=1850366 RepID=A0A3N9P3I9_9BACL|nr:helix-turn-helix domain-containing protein [Paenibacillus rhizophilus]RQW09930.1 DNA-binding protein [Paenibacillus rhizophilus]